MLRKRASADNTAEPPFKKPAAAVPEKAAAADPGQGLQADQPKLRDHTKMLWLASQIKKDNCPPHFLEVFQQQDKLSKSKGSALVNECVVRDGNDKWIIDCEKPIFKDRGITFDLPPIIECACLLHMHVE